MNKFQLKIPKINKSGINESGISFPYIHFISYTSIWPNHSNLFMERL